MRGTDILKAEVPQLKCHAITQFLGLPSLFFFVSTSIMPSFTRTFKDLISRKARGKEKDPNLGTPQNGPLISDTGVDQGSSSATDNGQLDFDEPPIGPLILFDEAGRNDSGTDVVFVHGLRGHRLRTWSTTKDNFCWPKELLPEDLKNSRVITWGYDASIAKFFQQASQESIFGHAGTLLDDLARLRHGIVSEALPSLPKDCLLLTSP